MNVCLYCRISVEDKLHNGVSLDMQEERLRHFAKAQQWRVVRVYRDNASGRSLERPALHQLINDARHKRFMKVMIFKLDRLCRNVRDLGELLEFFQKHKVGLVSLHESLDTESAAGKLLIHIMGSVAEWEVDTIRERTSWALRHRRDHLKVYGEVPYGFTRTGNDLRPVARELAVVRRIVRLRKKGRTLREIAGQLNRDHIPTKKGRTWAAMTIKYVLDNDLYARYLKGRK